MTFADSVVASSIVYGVVLLGQQHLSLLTEKRLNELVKKVSSVLGHHLNHNEP